MAKNNVFHRLKHTFTSGELSPRLGERLDFQRYNDGCRKLRNMTCLVQGPVTRRPGFQYIDDLSYLGADESKPVRMVRFVKSDTTAYVLIFFILRAGEVNAGQVRMVVATGDALVTTFHGAIYYVDLAPAELAAEIERFDYAQSLDVLYIALRNHTPMTLTHYAEDLWELTNAPITAFPSQDGATDDWVAPDDWPRTVTFFQQRLVFGGNKTHKQTVWMSKANAFNEFYEGTGASETSASPVTFRLDAGTQSQIQWLLSSKSLAIGTISNEWTVNSLSGATGAVTSSTVRAQRQTNIGSERVTPLMVGLATLFIERHGRTVNEFKYEYTTESYETSDRSVLATHLTENSYMKNWSFQQMPDQVLWITRSDGDLLGCTYQREHKVIGWHHHDTIGKVKYVCCIPGQERDDELWLIVERDFPLGPKYYLEKMRPEFISAKPDDGYFLDSHVVRYPIDSTIVTDLGHLEGLEVHVLTDGAVHPNRTVLNGEIILDTDTYSKVLVGLPYVSEVYPYLQDVPSNQGSAQGKQQRISKVFIDFYRTMGGVVGKIDSEDGEKTESLSFRKDQDLMGVAIPLFTGFYKYNFLEGFDSSANYFIRQTAPLPMTVRGVVDVVEVTE